MERARTCLSVLRVGVLLVAQCNLLVNRAAGTVTAEQRVSQEGCWFGTFPFEDVG